MNVLKRMSILLIVSAIFVTAAQPGIAGDDEERVLSSSTIQGSVPEELRELLTDVTVQRILIAVANEPREKEYLEAVLEKAGVTLEQLVSSGLVRAEKGRYVINYLLFTKEDMLRMREITDDHARRLARGILGRSSELEAIMERYELEDVDKKAVLYIILACYSLDWDGLVISADRGHRIPDRGKGERVIVWSWEPCGLSKKGFYKGSHNSSFGSVTFTSFGDHEIQPREALPDIIWRAAKNAPDERYPEELKSGIKGFVGAAMETAGEQLGQMMLVLRSGAKGPHELSAAAGVNAETAGAYLDFLTKMGYVEEAEGRYRSRIPVLVKADSLIVREVRRIGHEELVRYFDNHYGDLKEELSKLTPFRQGADLADYFYEVWHDIFGAANLMLVEEGLFPDPYSQRYGAKGIIPAVYDPLYFTFF